MATAELDLYLEQNIAEGNNQKVMDVLISLGLAFGKEMYAGFSRSCNLHCWTSTIRWTITVLGISLFDDLG